eukprot:CCRYP_020426-RA/>CCRYP_020426-RA protein AED:0.42 eAED:0.24 QI:0/0/0/1/1/1/2/0/232
MSLDQLPVRIISRLVTNNDDVVNFFASLDIKIECDVLGDYWGELDFNGFIKDLKFIVDQEKLVWNLVKGKLCTWIDLNRLKTVYQNNSFERIGQSKENFIKSTLDPSEENPSRRSSDPPDSSLHNRPSSHSRRQGPNSSARKKVFYISSSMPMPKAASVIYETQSYSLKDLYEVIQQWSHQSPSYKKMKPLQDLLVDVPSLFPPVNSFVESHDYFDKWKAFPADAFRFRGGK